MTISPRIPVVVATPHAYQVVGAGETAEPIGPGGGSTGDYIEGVLIVPAAAAAGAVTLHDGGTGIAIFAGGGTTALADLKPLYVKLGMTSRNGPRALTTGADVSAIAIGLFA